MGTDPVERHCSRPFLFEDFNRKVLGLGYLLWIEASLRGRYPKLGASNAAEPALTSFPALKDLQFRSCVTLISIPLESKSEKGECYSKGDQAKHQAVRCPLRLVIEAEGIEEVLHLGGKDSGLAFQTRVTL